MKGVRFNREITVQIKDVTNDNTFGTQVITWVPLSILPGSPEVAERFACEAMDLPGQSEALLGGDLVIARRITRIRMRWRDDIDSSMRVILHADIDRTMQIVGGPTEIGDRREGIELLCEEISS